MLGVTTPCTVIAPWNTGLSPTPPMENPPVADVPSFVTSSRVALGAPFPNPCNPLTNIQMVLPEGIAVQGHGAVLQIFDVRGSLVKTLESSRVVDNRVSCQWDGTSDSGGLVASGRYLYIYRLDQYLARGAVTLVR